MKFKKGDIVISAHHPHEKLQNSYEIIGVVDDMPTNPQVPTERIKLQAGMRYLLRLSLENELAEDQKKKLYAYVQANDDMLTPCK